MSTCEIYYLAAAEEEEIDCDFGINALMYICGLKNVKQSTNTLKLT